MKTKGSAKKPATSSAKVSSKGVNQSIAAPRRGKGKVESTTAVPVVASGGPGPNKKLPILNGNEYLTEVNELEATLPHWAALFSAKAEASRAEEWVRLSVIGGAISDKYAWSIPNEKALSIIANFGPIVEIAAGKGYWGRMLQEYGVDIVCFDKHVSKGAWTRVSGVHYILAR